MVKRIKKEPFITTSNADFKPQHTAKSKQAWRYQGNQILRAPSVWINGTKYIDPKDPDQARRKQESNFFVTINTNKSPDDEQMPRAVAQMTNVLETLSQRYTMAAYFKFGPVDPTYEEDKFEDVITSNIEWKAAIETGDIMNRLHCHIWLTVTHYSQIQMNTKMLQHLTRENFNKGLRLGDPLRITDNAYVHVKLLPQSDWTSIMKNYIHKGMNQA